MPPSSSAAPCCSPSLRTSRAAQSPCNRSLRRCLKGNRRIAGVHAERMHWNGVGSACNPGAYSAYACGARAGEVCAVDDEQTSLACEWSELEREDCLRLQSSVDDNCSLQSKHSDRVRRADHKLQLLSIIFFRKGRAKLSRTQACFVYASPRQWLLLWRCNSHVKLSAEIKCGVLSSPESRKR